MSIGSGWGRDDNHIWTLEMDASVDDSAHPLPIVLLHGFGCGASIWSLNLEALSKHRRVYALDVLGFGRSSRPDFACSEKMAEFEMIRSIDCWRKAVGLTDKFILCGHSFGGYLALAYALQFSTHVAHVVLADPWGIPEQPAYKTAFAGMTAQPVLSWFVDLLSVLVFETLNPLSLLRAAGPLGPCLVHLLRQDIRRKFEALTGEEEASVVLDYVYHCNAQSNPAGEMAFKTLALPTGWARNPMIARIDKLEPHIDLSFIYGGRSWIDRQPGIQIKQLCSERSVEVHVIHGAGHHVYADKLHDFNRLVNAACRAADERHRVRVAQERQAALEGQD